MLCAEENKSDTADFADYSELQISAAFSLQSASDDTIIETTSTADEQQENAGVISTDEHTRFISHDTNTGVIFPDDNTGVISPDENTGVSSPDEQMDISEL